MKNHLSKAKLSTLIIASIGVVYGDIGTSPLYALKTCLAMSGQEINSSLILGIISLFIWSLILIVSIKYVKIVLSMDHNGEGGILALSSLASAVCPSKRRPQIIFLGILGMTLFFGDGIITPAISVLSAIEGISLMSHQLDLYVLPITVVVLTSLFGIQKYGTSTIGRFFGPIMIIWFVVLLTLGLYQIFQNPYILKAFNPYYAILFLKTNFKISFTIMGAIILVVTGAEALYADLGHFGKKPIRLSWTFFVFPSLMINYLGQGALLLSSPQAILNPFYLMAPEWGLKPLVVLSTLATIIASQAIISGLYSVAWQAMLLNYIPRMKVYNTSAQHIGQVYVPAINIIIYCLTIMAVLHFKSSKDLAFAYGFCVSAIMMLTTSLVFLIALEKWEWGWVKKFLLFGPLFLFDILFVSSNLIKFFEGAWYTIAITALITYLIYTWIKGNKALENQRVIVSMLLKEFVTTHLKNYPERIPGTAIFLNRDPLKVPSSLFMHLHHNKYLHEKVIFVSLLIQEIPYIKAEKRFCLESIEENNVQLVCNFGFKEVPDLNKILIWLEEKEVIHCREDVSIFISRRIPVSSKLKVLSGISEKIYMILVSLSQDAVDFYRIPPHKVLELGIRYKI